MKNNDDNKKLPGLKAGDKKKSNLQGYPLYPVSEDVYSESHIKKNIDPEDGSLKKGSIEKYKGEKNNEKDFVDDVSGSDLDVPGSELDDIQENIGSEDEENNYYSIGGDDHEDLDEDKGD
jgi:hypothetical protein